MYKTTLNSAVLLVALFIAVIPTSAGQPFDPSAARAAIQSAYDKSNAAASKKDIDGMLASCSTDFVIMLPDRPPEDLAWLRKELDALMQIFTSVTNETRITNVTADGNGAIVELTEHQVIATKFGPNSATLTFDNVCRDYWVDTGSGWKQKRTNLLSSTHTIKGHGIGITYAFHW